MAAKTLTPHARRSESLAGEREKNYGAPFLSFLEEMNNLIDGFFRESGIEPVRERVKTFIPAVDVIDGEDEIVVSVELPGMGREDVDVSLSKDVLTIKGEKKTTEEGRRKGFYLERIFGSFNRSLRLPMEVKADKITAVFKDGVLIITLPKARDTFRGAKKISIKSD